MVTFIIVVLVCGVLEVGLLTGGGFGIWFVISTGNLGYLQWVGSLGGGGFS